MAARMISGEFDEGFFDGMAQSPEKRIETAERIIMPRSTVLIAATTDNEELAE